MTNEPQTRGKSSIKTSIHPAPDREVRKEHRPALALAASSVASSRPDGHSSHPVPAGPPNPTRRASRPRGGPSGGGFFPPPTPTSSVVGSPAEFGARTIYLPTTRPGHFSRSPRAISPGSTRRVVDPLARPRHRVRASSSSHRHHGRFDQPAIRGPSSRRARLRWWNSSSSPSRARVDAAHAVRAHSMAAACLRSGLDRGSLEGPPVAGLEPDKSLNEVQTPPGDRPPKRLDAPSVSSHSIPFTTPSGRKAYLAARRGPATSSRNSPQHHTPPTASRGSTVRRHDDRYGVPLRPEPHRQHLHPRLGDTCPSALATDPARKTGPGRRPVTAPTRPTSAPTGRVYFGSSTPRLRRPSRYSWSDYVVQRPARTPGPLSAPADLSPHHTSARPARTVPGAVTSCGPAAPVRRASSLAPSRSNLSPRHPPRRGGDPAAHEPCQRPPHRVIPRSNQTTGARNGVA